MNGITLAEYVEQEIPERGNKVILVDLDYSIGFTFNHQEGTERQVIVKNFEDYVYSLIGDSGYLYVVDSDGNRRGRSVFYIDKVKE